MYAEFYQKTNGDPRRTIVQSFFKGKKLTFLDNYSIFGIKAKCKTHNFEHLFTHGKNYFVVKCSKPNCFESITFFQRRD